MAASYREAAFFNRFRFQMRMACVSGFAAKHLTLGVLARTICPTHFDKQHWLGYAVPMRESFMRAFFAALLITPAVACAPVAAPQVAAPDRIAVAQQVIAAERDFAARAQRDGQWTAFRATAAPGALLFWPGPTPVERALAGLADPPRSVNWQPHRVVIACDNTLAATTGAAQWPDGRHGWFTTIWARQADGSWKWIADHGGIVPTALPEPATPAVELAECPGAEGPEPQGTPGPDEVRGGSRDDTLLWDFVPGANGGDGGGLRVTMWIGPRYAPTILPGPPVPVSAR